MVVDSDPPPAHALRKDVARDLERVIELCLKKDPGRRFQSMADVKLQLEALGQEWDSGVLRAIDLGAPGRGLTVVPAGDGTRVAVINLQGGLFMDTQVHPFLVAEELVAEARRETPIILVDFHAEATSEKVAMGWYLDGLVSAVIGTHTHVQTADERVLPKGTAFICDVGMTGPRDGVLGMDRERIIERFLTSLPIRFEVASGPAQLNAVAVEIDEDTGRARSIERICETDDDAD